MRGLLAVAGAISVVVASILAPASVARAANVLTVTGYTALGQLQWDMADMLQGGFCSAASGNSCEEVRYISGSSVLGEPTGLWALRPAIRSAEPPTVVVGFSQGATVATQWLRENDGQWDAPSPDDVSFVLLANPLRKYGGSRPAYAPTEQPTPDTDYRVLDIAVEYDGAADVPDNLLNPLAVANAVAGFTYIHIPGYADYHLDTAEKIIWIEGNTTYVLIRSENIPLLEPLRTLGLDELADSLNDPLKAIIDSAYDRDYPGLVDPQSHDEVLAEFPYATDTALDGAPDTASLRVADTATEEVTGDTASVDADVAVTTDAPEVDTGDRQPTVEPQPEPEPEEMADPGTDADGSALTATALAEEDAEEDEFGAVADQAADEQDLDEQDGGESSSEVAGAADSDDDTETSSDSEDDSDRDSDSSDASDNASDSGTDSGSSDDGSGE